MGVRPTAPAWRTWSIKPAPGNLTHANITVPTPHGPISAVLSIRGSLRAWELHLHVPAGTTAQVCLARLWTIGDVEGMEDYLVVNGVAVAGRVAGKYLCVEGITTAVVVKTVEHP